MLSSFYERENKFREIDLPLPYQISLKNKKELILVVWNLGFILTFSIWHNPCQTKSIEHYHYVRSKQIAIRKQKRRGAHPESYWSLKCGDVTATSRDCWMTRFRWRAVQWGCASSALTPLCCRPETDQSQYHWTKRKNQKISDLQVKRL